MDRNLSIHPRNWPNMMNRQKRNTCVSSKDGKKHGYLRKIEKKLGIRRLECAATRKNLPSTINPEAYKIPGSMRLDKN